MDGVSNHLGTRILDFKLEGDTYHFRVFNLDGYAEKEGYILSLKASPMEVVSQLPANYPAHLTAKFLELAMAEAMKPRYITRDEEKRFDMSLHGLAWSLWRGLRETREEYGKPADGAKVVYTTPDGDGFTMTPTEGVSAMYRFIEKAGKHRFAELVAIRDGIEEPPELGKSSGLGTSTTTDQGNQADTGDTPGQDSSGQSSNGQTGPLTESEN